MACGDDDDDNSAAPNQDTRTEFSLDSQEGIKSFLQNKKLISTGVVVNGVEQPADPCLLDDEFEFYDNDNFNFYENTPCDREVEVDYTGIWSISEMQKVFYLNLTNDGLTLTFKLSKLSKTQLNMQYEIVDNGVVTVVEFLHGVEELNN